MHFHREINQSPMFDMSDELLQHAEKAPISKNRRGRSSSTLWELFSEELEPQLRTSSTCRHCQKSIVYHKKSEQVKDHLLKCDALYNGNRRRFAPSLVYEEEVVLKQEIEGWAALFIWSIVVAAVNKTVLSSLFETIRAEDDREQSRDVFLHHGYIIPSSRRKAFT